MVRKPTLNKSNDNINIFINFPYSIDHVNILSHSITIQKANKYSKKLISVIFFILFKAL